MKFDFVVLGATGMQGKIATRDLLEHGYSVLLCGRDRSRVVPLLKRFPKTHFSHVDLRNVEKASQVIKDSGANVVLNCVEGDWNLNALKACMNAKVDSIDLGSDIDMTKKQLAFNEELKRKDLIHITGCGSIPGTVNVMLRHASEKFNKITSVEAGFAWDSNIKKFVVPFSIKSIIQEMTEPAPKIENGRLKHVMPMDTICKLYRYGIGNQHCILIHHPEVYTFYRYFKDKGLKNVKAWGGFPDHSFDKLNAMIELGFGSEEEVRYNGFKVKPIDVLTQVLKRIKMPQGYKEKENLWVRITGENGRKHKEIEMECLVSSLPGWEEAGSNIDTGMPASIIAQMIKEEVIAEKGSFAPEAVVPPAPYFKQLRKRKMVVYENRRIIN